jgi:small-conductance mechanosensitive channel
LRLIALVWIFLIERLRRKINYKTMQYKFFPASAFILSLVLLACNEQAVVEKATEATMKVHDEAMRLIGPMQGLNRQLKAEMASLDSLSPRYDSLAQAVRAIGRADRDMKQWMAEFEAPAANIPTQEALSYLKEQLTKIQKNYNDINAATEEAKRLVNAKN